MSDEWLFPLGDRAQWRIPKQIWLNSWTELCVVMFVVWSLMWLLLKNIRREETSKNINLKCGTTKKNILIQTQPWLSAPQKPTEGFYIQQHRSFLLNILIILWSEHDVKWLFSLLLYKDISVWQQIKKTKVFWKITIGQPSKDEAGLFSSVKIKD